MRETILSQNVKALAGLTIEIGTNHSNIKGTLAQRGEGLQRTGGDVDCIEAALSPQCVS
jgi:hypothetical protein